MPTKFTDFPVSDLSRKLGYLQFYVQLKLCVISFHITCTLLLLPVNFMR